MLVCTCRRPYKLWVASQERSMCRTSRPAWSPGSAVPSPGSVSFWPECVLHFLSRGGGAPHSWPPTPPAPTHPQSRKACGPHVAGPGSATGWPLVLYPPKDTLVPVWGPHRGLGAGLPKPWQCRLAPWCWAQSRAGPQAQPSPSPTRHLPGSFYQSFRRGASPGASGGSLAHSAGACPFVYLFV